jgi:hypothetical protein
LEGWLDAAQVADSARLTPVFVRVIVAPFFAPELARLSAKDRAIILGEAPVPRPPMTVTPHAPPPATAATAGFKLPSFVSGSSAAAPTSIGPEGGGLVSSGPMTSSSQLDALQQNVFKPFKKDPAKQVRLQTGFSSRCNMQHPVSQSNPLKSGRHATKRL